MDDCLFCKIAAGEIPSQALYEDADVFVFLDVFPATQGHTLVVPKTHATNLYDATPEVMAPVFRRAAELGPKIAEAVGAAGFRLLMNNGEASGQTVFHPHVHLIPVREKGDLPGWDHQERTKDELAADKDRIIKALAL